MQHYVSRDGIRVSPLFDDPNDGFKWLMDHQPMSTDWAIRYAGYRFETHSGGRTEIEEAAP